MTTMILGMIFSAALGPNAQAQGDDNAVTQTPISVAAPMTATVDDEQSQTGEDPGRGSGGGGRGGNPGRGGGMPGGHAGNPGRVGNPGGHAGTPHQGNPGRVGHPGTPGRVGHPGNPGHAGNHPGNPGHNGPGRGNPGRVGHPGQPGHSGYPGGRPHAGAHRANGSHYWGGRAPGHYYGRGWRRPGYNVSFIWNPGLYPFWWEAGIEFAPFAYISDIPAGEFQCTAFDSELNATSDVGDTMNEAAYNALYACGGPNYVTDGCYIPTGYCRRR